MKAACVLSAGVTLCLATSLSAKTQPNLDGERILADFARCAARNAPRATRAVIDTMPNSDDERRQLDLLIQTQGKCLDFGPSLNDQRLAAAVSLGQMSLGTAVGQLSNQQRQMTLSLRAFRGAIAERLYLDSAKTAPTAAPLSTEFDSRDAALPAGYAVVKCAVARDPMSADRLVRSKRLSADESDAARALAPFLNGCARGRGKVDISGTAIHGWAAEALFKLRNNTAAGAN